MAHKNSIFIQAFKIIRPHQWVKNILVFIPMLVSHNFDLDNFIFSIKSFIIFSLTASAIYVINDMIDEKNDRNHPYKKNRPLAAKLITINQCKVIIFILLILSTFFLLDTNKSFFYLIILYFITSNLYTFFLKKLKIVDLVILSFLYTLRILGGGLITDISISSWLFTFSVFFFISLASVKRLTELINAKKYKKEKIYGRGYTIKDKKLINIVAITSGLISILVLTLYINSPQVLELYSFSNILWGAWIIIFFWISRIIYASNKGKIKDDPIVYAISDKISYLCLLIILFIIWLGSTI